MLFVRVARLGERRLTQNFRTYNSNLYSSCRTSRPSLPCTGCATSAFFGRRAVVLIHYLLPGSTRTNAPPTRLHPYTSWLQSTSNSCHTSKSSRATVVLMHSPLSSCTHTTFALTHKCFCRSRKSLNHPWSCHLHPLYLVVVALPSSCLCHNQL